MDETPGHRERMLREFLREVDEACPACGYGLRGLEEPACPECGEPLRLRVSVAEPPMGAFLGGLLGLAFGAGWFVWSLGIGAVGAARHGGGGPGVRTLLPFIAGACACGAPLALWIGRRHRLSDAPPGARGWMVALCWAWSGAAVAVAALTL